MVLELTYIVQFNELTKIVKPTVYLIGCDSSLYVAL